MQKSSRSVEIETFLESFDMHGCKRVAVAGDASFRKYERIFADNKTYILMDAPPDKEDIKPFIKIAEHLSNNSFSAPMIVGYDLPNGFILLEDLGDNLYSRFLGTNCETEAEKKLYEYAIDVLVELKNKKLPDAIPEYDSELYLRESLLFVDWFLAGALGEKNAKSIRDEYTKIISALIGKQHLSQDVLVLRDYHADNLIWLDDRESVKKVGLLDFQDAVAGPAEYDLVSLIEDARRGLMPTTSAHCLDYYIEKSGTTDVEKFYTNYYLLGAQRNLKIIGIFHRLNRRDGKPDYLNFLPRVWAHLEKDLEHPYLLPLKDWLDKHVPKEIRK